MELTHKLSEFITSTDFNDIPSEMINEVKLCFLDWLGVALAGAIDPEINSLLEVIQLVGGKKQATIIGKKNKTSILNATLLNGMISHVLDYDDTSVEFLGHPSVTLFPCLLAVSEWAEKSGEEFLCAYVIGFEIGCRVGLGATTNHYLGGWHGTSTIGHFASTASCAKLLGLNTQQTVHALGTAGTQAAGIKAVFGTSCKPFHAGKASFNGLLSTLLAQRGFTSVNDILEGEKCFWDIFSTKPRPKRALKDLGKKWYILNNRYKFHASCYGTHAHIEAILALKKEFDIDPNKIEKIEVIVSPPTIEIAGKEKPITGLEGKFSIPYTIANALLRETTGLAAFTDERVNDPEIIKLRDKVKMVPDSRIAPFMSEMTVFIGGEKYQKQFNILQQILAPDEKKRMLEKKFRSLAGLTIEENNIQKIIRRIENLEQETNMANVVKQLNSNI